MAQPEVLAAYREADLFVLALQGGERRRPGWPPQRSDRGAKPAARLYFDQRFGNPGVDRARCDRTACSARQPSSARRSVGAPDPRSCGAGPAWGGRRTPSAPTFLHGGRDRSAGGALWAAFRLRPSQKAPVSPSCGLRGRFVVGSKPQLKWNAHRLLRAAETSRSSNSFGRPSGRAAVPRGLAGGWARCLPSLPISQL